MSEPSCSREAIADCATLGIVHRPDEREWLRGVRTRNRVGGNLWEWFPPYLSESQGSSTVLEFGIDQSNSVTTVGKENMFRYPTIRYGPIR